MDYCWSHGLFGLLCSTLQVLHCPEMPRYMYFLDFRAVQYYRTVESLALNLPLPSYPGECILLLFFSPEYRGVYSRLKRFRQIRQPAALGIPCLMLVTV